MARTGRRHDKEFKVEAVRLIVEKNHTVSDVANDLGVNVKTLYGWVRQYTKHKDNAFPGSGRLRPEDYKLRMLQRRIDDLEEENAILKKAGAFFANHRS